MKLIRRFIALKMSILRVDAAIIKRKKVKRNGYPRLPNGQEIDDFYTVTIRDAAAIVAVDEAGNLILKNEYRYCYGRSLIEVPAGTFEADETDGLAVAKRELLEETGYGLCVPASNLTRARRFFCAGQSHPAGNCAIISRVGLTGLPNFNRKGASP